MPSVFEQHPLFGRFRLFSGQIDAGFESWFYGVRVRDWLFSGKSKNLPGGPVSVGPPPVNCEYFEWLALMAAMLSAKDRFTMVECGAGWGRWLAAASQLARQRNLKIRLVGLEGDVGHFGWMQMVLRDNGVAPEDLDLQNVVVAAEPGHVQFLTSDEPATFYGQRIVTTEEAISLRREANVRCDRRTAVSLSGVLGLVDRVDLISIDIGGYEDKVVASALEPLRAQARVLQIATSTQASHDHLAATLEREGWRRVFRFPPGGVSETPAGPVPFDQGLQVWVCEQAVFDWFDPNALPPAEPPGFAPTLYEPAPRTWIHVGAGAGEKTFAAAKDDPSLRVYAFEPDLELASVRVGQLANYVTLPLAVGLEDGSATFYRNALRSASSLKPLIEEGRACWKDGEQLRVEKECPVPVTRLDTFLNGMSAGQVEHLKIDAPGSGLAVVQSAGKCLDSVFKISLVVQTAAVPLYAGAPTAAETTAWLKTAGFELVSIEEQSFGQEENLTFVRSRDLQTDEDGVLLARARELAAFRPLVPEPGWEFDRDWNSTDPVIQERRAIWEHFHIRGCAGPLTVDWLDGIRLTVYLGNDLSRQIFALGRFEPNEFAWLSGLLQPGMCFVDAGANEGVYTLFAASRVGPAGQVWAFEPSPREFARLAANCAQNGHRHVRLFRSALSAEDGTASLSIVAGAHAGQNLLSQPTGLPVLRHELVRTERFDEVAARDNLQRLDVMKIDVEGEEYRLLHGAEQSIRRFRPVILFECSDRLLRGRGAGSAALRELLSGWGYQICAFDAATGLLVPYTEGDDLNLVARPR